jgi:phosphopantothenoylcysteine decarboxylase/phosphopantothenate--cysteine ligase
MLGAVLSSVDQRRRSSWPQRPSPTGGPATAADQKIKKDGSGDTPTLNFIENPDILAAVAQSPRGQSRSAGDPGGLYCVGFAAESHDLLARTPLPSACARACRCWSAISARPPLVRTTTHSCWWTLMGATEVPRASKRVLARKLIAEIDRRTLGWVHKK